MARHTDRRVQRTRKLLRESIMALILEEGYDAISIQDITDKANLGRATFYLHFKDKDDLLLDVIDQLMEDFFCQVPELSQVQWRLENEKSINKLFDFAADHYDLYRILIIGSGGITASRQLHKKIAENILTCIQEDVEISNLQPLIDPVFIANHYAGSLLATIYWWLDNDLPYEVEEMATMFQKTHKLDQDTLMGHDNHQHPEMSTKKRKDRDKARKKGVEKKTPPLTEAALSQKQVIVDATTEEDGTE